MDVLPLFECPICADVLSSTVETPCCNSLYCQGCLTEWKKSRTNCPSCRARISMDTCKPNVPVQRFVDSLPVECPFVLNGCSASTTRSELEKHKELCDFSSTKIDSGIKKKTEAMKKDLLLRIKKYESMDKRVKSNNLGELSTLAAFFTTTAASLQDLGEFAYAEKSISKAIEAKTVLSPDRPRDLSLLAKKAELLNHQGLFQDALQLCIPYTLVSGPISHAQTQLLYVVGTSHLKTGKLENANDTFKKSLQHFESGCTESNLRKECQRMQAEILTAMGLVLKKKSRYAEALQLYDRSRKLCESGSQVEIDVMVQMADVYRKQEKFNTARDLYQSCLKASEQIYGQQHPKVGDIWNALGMLEKKVGNYEAGLGHYKKALRIAQHFFGKKHSTVGIYLTNLGDIFRKKGDYQQAEATYFTALMTLEESLGKEHVEVAEVLNSMGLVAKKRGDYDAAEKMYLRAIEIVQKGLGSGNYKLGIYKNNLGDTFRKRRQLDQAMSCYEDSLSIIGKSLGNGHSEAADPIHNIGQVLVEQGKDKDAVVQYKKAIDILVKEFGPTHYKVGMVMNNLGLAQAKMEDYDTSYETLKKALSILKVALGPTHVETADVYMQLGDVCMKLLAGKLGKKKEKLEEAKRYYTCALQIIEKSFGKEHKKTMQLQSLLFICSNYDSLSS